MADNATQFMRDGFVVFDHDPRVARWTTRAHAAGVAAAADPALRTAWLRHQETWFVGVDALSNDGFGTVGDAPLAGPWEGVVRQPTLWHPAQVSITYPHYPMRDADESEAAHRFRIKRCAAHVDGLHLEGERRILREPHAFILGIPLNDCISCPLVVWRGSHIMMRAALADAIGGGDVMGADVTDVYKRTRAQVFERCEKDVVTMKPGQSVLVDRFAVHGVAPWQQGDQMPPEGRMVAYFRPEFETPNDWITA